MRKIKRELYTKNNFLKYYNLIKFLVVLYMNIQIWIIFFKMDNLLNRLILLPFCLCFFCTFGQVLGRFFNKYMIVKFFSKLYVLIFLGYWFLVCGIGTYGAIRDREYSMILFILLFWIVGIFVIYRKFIKKK